VIFIRNYLPGYLKGISKASERHLEGIWKAKMAFRCLSDTFQIPWRIPGDPVKIYDIIYSHSRIIYKRQLTEFN
jgi:hypothetical protein